MDELEEGMLAIGARLAPHHRTGRGIGGRSVELDVLAVALHLQLLEIGGETPKPLVIGDHAVGGVAENVAVPAAQQSHQDRNVAIDRRFAEVLIDLIGAAQEFVEPVGPDRNRERQSDARPDRIAAADPVPEAEHPRRLDAELRDLVELGRDCGEMVVHRRFANPLRDPCAGGRRVGHCLHSGERLRRDDEQRPRGVEAAQGVADIRPVDVGDEVAAQLRRRERRQGAGRHRRAEVGPADADIDDVGHRLAERAAHAALAYVGGELEHPLPRVEDVRHDVVTVDQHRLAGEIAQSGVKDRALLGDVDLLAGEHRLPLGFNPGGLGQFDERRQNRRIDPLLRIVEQEIVKGDAERLETIGMVGEIRSRGPREHALAHAGQFRQRR